MKGPIGDNSRFFAELAKAGEVEVYCDGIADGWGDRDGGRVGVEGTSGKMDRDGRSPQGAGSIGAVVVGLAVKALRLEFLFALEHLDIEVAPEVRGAQSVGGS